MQNHSRVDTSATLARTFSRTPVQLNVYTKEMQINIIRGNLTNNMTKDQVIFARGYPPFHRTPSLTQNSWKYWNTKHGTQTIQFTNGVLGGIGMPYSSLPVALTQVQNPIINTKLPYNFTKTNISQPDSFVLAIGINKYQENPDVAYADKSALAFAELAKTTMGVPKENIITLTNEQATSGQLKAKMELIKELSDSRGNLYIYFAGHGVPGKDGATYILPYDMNADTIHLEPNLRLDKIYAKLAKLDVKKVFVIMDTCFSGKDDDGSLLYKGVAPVLKSKKVKVTSSKLTVLTAGKSTDFANDFESKQQRMFTYYLIDELSKGKSNISEIYPEIQSRVKRSSLMKGLGYKQIPQKYGNTSQKFY
ncbi:caspase family protein [Sulfurimonas sp. SAG-AH-194-C20]|nr:caspase family protein [Sulfurimonas sp. SAG-AH-194-C20]